jgi:RNA polymerase sigma factor (sigma-70 family)
MAHHHLSRYVDVVEADRQAARSAAGGVGQLARAAGARDGTAWTLLVERFTRGIRAVARSHRMSQHDVDDIVQTTWLRLLEHHDEIRDPNAVGAWLFTTARRESLRTLRNATREQPTEADQLADRLGDDGEPRHEHRLVQATLRAAVHDALARLPERDRTLLGLLFAEPELSYADISSAMHMPIGSIGPTRQRSLARLRVDSHLAQAIGPDD